MWQARTEPVPSGIRLRLFDDGSPLSHRSVFALLERDAEFAAWYTSLLAGCGFEAFYWEHPSFTSERLDDHSEFVLLDAPELAHVSPEPAAFAEPFATAPGEEVIVFENLGGDALLVAPTPVTAHEAYPHLGAFVRGAPAGQIAALWRAAGRVVREHVRDEPRWLSTAGLGVSWLHLRLDTRPKYYRHRAYA